MDQIAGWIAPTATMLAAMMTAANLGARVTGWGFVVFTIGSVAWSVVAVSTGQQNLLLTNGFLTLVNGVGIWRWLGRQARYEAGGAAATERSSVARVPDLFAVGSMSGAKVVNSEGQALGTIAEAMMQCSGAALAYVVVSEGGVGGVGERLHAVAPGAFQFSEKGIVCDLTPQALAALPVLEEDNWPVGLA